MLEQLDHRPQRRNVQTIRSQVALELLFNLYALVVAIVILRLVLILLGVSDRVWIGATVYSLTDPVVRPLNLLPGGRRELLGSLTLAELTLVGLLILFPLGLVALGGRGRRR